MEPYERALPMVKIQSEGLHVGKFFWQWYRFTCPHCGGDLGKSLSAVRAGTGKEVCLYCWKEYVGSKEWPQMSLADKFDLLFPPTVLIYIGVALILAISGVMAGYDSHEKLFLGFMGFSLFALPWVPYFVKRYRQIVRSKPR